MTALFLKLKNHSLPKGWRDVVIQLCIFAGAYYSYQLVRGLAESTHVQAAFTHGRHIIGLERSLGAFFEPSLQTWVLNNGLLSNFASWMYMNSHFTITVSTLIFVYLFRNHHYLFLRNMLIVAMGLALIGYALYPTAPPRFFPEWGFVDSVAHFTGIQDSSIENIFFNPFAAVPSMHVAFALMIGFTMAKIVRFPAMKGFWIFYPLLVTFVVLATGNHYWFDVVLGALVAAISAIASKASLKRLQTPQAITSSA